MAKGDNWDACRFLEVCCDYGVCQNQMLEELGKTCDTERCANWINDHLIDAQDDDDETCRECVWK